MYSGAFNLIGLIHTAPPRYPRPSGDGVSPLFSPQQREGGNVKSIRQRRQRPSFGESTEKMLAPGGQHRHRKAEERLSSATAATTIFKRDFIDNPFGFAYSVCDRLWTKEDLGCITASMLVYNTSQYGVKVPVVNIPVDTDPMLAVLPHNVEKPTEIEVQLVHKEEGGGGKARRSSEESEAMMGVHVTCVMLDNNVDTDLLGLAEQQENNKISTPMCPIVRRREDVMPSGEYYARMRMTDEGYTSLHGRCSIACTTNGKAAVALGGVTVHSAFKMIMRHRDHDRGLSHSHLSTFRTLLRNIKGVIKDKFSMLSVDMVYINRKFDPITSSSPVFKRPKTRGCVYVTSVTPRNNLSFYCFTQVARQSDVTFSIVLTKIGDGSELSAEENTLTESRFISTVDAALLYPGAVRLFSNKEADNFNQRVVNNIDSTLPCPAVDKVAGNRPLSSPCRPSRNYKLILDGETVLALVNVRSLATHVFDVEFRPTNARELSTQRPVLDLFASMYPMPVLYAAVKLAPCVCQTG
ncbi:hypothetical protein HPB49_008088 [Dermacentor silvarum]|uniref:Uncharacterized protein n=1 Tax=Dermacentor silvarum TaxID=543639 RepID=A0ACB8C2M5_DERSI|nr:hypothetical protein HPB49_008088 [Dermacentor silvarum]